MFRFLLRCLRRLKKSREAGLSARIITVGHLLCHVYNWEYRPFPGGLQSRERKTGWSAFADHDSGAGWGFAGGPQAWAVVSARGEHALAGFVPQPEGDNCA